MITYISVLRGINVSGHKLIKMDALRQLYLDLGFKNVQTYIQSGNVIFQAKIAETEDLENKISRKIAGAYNFEVPVIVKELSEIKEISQNNPFLSENAVDVAKLHVTFLSAQPLKTAIDKLPDRNFDPDEFKVIKKTVYLFCPNGYGNTRLSNTFFENKLKVTATTRNWKTINELVNIAEKIKKNSGGLPQMLKDLNSNKPNF